MLDAKTEVRYSAMNFLAMREHTEKELLDKLRRKSAVNESEIRQVLNTLKVEGYLSDERFAESYIRTRANRGYGREKIEQELIEKGVDADSYQAILDAYDDDWPRLIIGVWRKKFNKVPSGFPERVKQNNFLRYRGFRQRDIEQLYGELIQED